MDIKSRYIQYQNTEYRIYFIIVQEIFIKFIDTCMAMLTFQAINSRQNQNNPNSRSHSGYCFISEQRWFYMIYVYISRASVEKSSLKQADDNAKVR